MPAVFAMCFISGEFLKSGLAMRRRFIASGWKKRDMKSGIPSDVESRFLLFFEPNGSGRFASFCVKTNFIVCHCLRLYLISQLQVFCFPNIPVFAGRHADIFFEIG